MALVGSAWLSGRTQKILKTHINQMNSFITIRILHEQDSIREHHKYSLPFFLLMFSLGEQIET